MQRQKELADLRALEREARKNCPGFLDAPMGFKKCTEADELRQEIETLEKQDN